MDDPELYVKSNDFQRSDAIFVLKEYLEDMKWKKEGERIIDIGCGPGDVTTNILIPMLPYYDSLVGIDLSPRMIDYASKQFGHINSKLSFEVVDILDAVKQRQKFPTGFSKVFSFYCLHWIKDIALVLKNTYNLLQPSGEALLLFGGKAPFFAAYEELNKISQWQPYMKDFEKFIPIWHTSVNPSEVFSCLAREAGFHIVDCKTCPLSHVFDSEKAYLDMLRSVNPFLHRIPGDKQEAYMQCCSEKFLAQEEVNVLQDGNKIKFTLNSMIAHLCKNE